jgi:ankyrin repeat protein
MTIRCLIFFALASLPVEAANYVEFADQPWVARRMAQAVLVDQDLYEAERLLKGGFDPQTPIGCGTFNSLDGAVYRANPEMVGLLLRYGARPRERTLAQAAFLKQFDSAVTIVAELLQAGVDVNSKAHYTQNPAWYWTALHQAVWRENVALVRLLLAQKGISLNDINGDGLSALAIAKEKGNSTITDLLLQAGADPELGTRRPRPYGQEVSMN